MADWNADDKLHFVKRAYYFDATRSLRSSFDAIEGFPYSIGQYPYTNIRSHIGPTHAYRLKKTKKTNKHPCRANMPALVYMTHVCMQAYVNTRDHSYMRTSRTSQTWTKSCRHARTLTRHYSNYPTSHTPTIFTNIRRPFRASVLLCNCCHTVASPAPSSSIVPQSLMASDRVVSLWFQHLTDCFTTLSTGLLLHKQRGRGRHRFSAMARNNYKVVKATITSSSESQETCYYSINVSIVRCRDYVVSILSKPRSTAHAQLSMSCDIK